jgi:hypothetical protein
MKGWAARAAIAAIATVTRFGGLEQHALAVALGEHDPAAVGHARQRGKWNKFEALGRRGRALGLQAQVLRGQKQVVAAQGLAGCLAESVAQRGGLGDDVVKAGDDAQRVQRIGGLPSRASTCSALAHGCASETGSTSSMSWFLPWSARERGAVRSCDEWEPL